MSVGMNIKLRRIALKIPQMEMAEKLGVSAAMISQIEQDRKNPPLMLCKGIADILGCSVDDLLSGKSA